jgi:hypothetical protein
MLRLFPGTLLILLSWLPMLGVFAGIGLLLRRAFGASSLSVATVLDQVWPGFGATVLFLMIWNFFQPVNEAAAAIALAAGVAGLWVHRRALAAVLAGGVTRPAGWAIAAAGVAGFWIANLSVGDLTAWDSALYHWQGVRWAREYPAVPGLANLFGPLGFNNAAFLYDAVLDVGPWEGRSYHLATGFFPFAFACLAASATVLLFGGDEGARPRAVFVLAGLTGAAQAPWSALPSYVTDVATTIVVLVLTSSWYGFLTRGEPRPVEDAWAVVRIVLLAALAVSLKLNMAVLGAVTVIAVCGQFLAERPDRALGRRTLGWAAVIAALFGVAWTARGIVLSGYPAFPSTALPAPVEWRAPEEHARAEFAFIVDSGRRTASVPEVVSGRAGVGRWLPDWLIGHREQVFYAAVPLALLAVALTAALRARARAPADALARTRAAWWMAAPLAVAIAAWFSTAPEPRYASPFFWSLAALAVAQVCVLTGLPGDRARVRRLVIAAWLGAGASVVVQPFLYWLVKGRRGSVVRAVARETVRVPPPGHWLYPRAEALVMTPYVTRSGLVLNLPAHRCWEAPLPCTPNPAPNLRLRDPARIERGFVVDGGWQMEHWPQRWRPDYLRTLRTRPGWGATATP